MNIVAAHGPPAALTSFEHAVDQLDTAMAPPSALQRLLEMLADPDVPWPRIESTLAANGGLVARVLRLASTPAFAARPVRDLGTAMRTLGSVELRRLVVAAHFAGGGTPLARRVWADSLRIALTSAALASLAGRRGGPDPFLCGLLHDIGTIAFESIFGAAYTAIGIVPGEDTQSERERAHFGFDHADLGAMVASRWNLFPELELVAQLHHDPAACDLIGVDPLTRTAVEVVALARLLGRASDDVAAPSRDAACARLGLTVDAAEQCAVTAAAQATELLRAVAA